MGSHLTTPWWRWATLGLISPLKCACIWGMLVFDNESLQRPPFWPLLILFANICKRPWINRNVSDLMVFQTCQKDQVHSNPLSHLNNFWHIQTSSFTGKLAVCIISGRLHPLLWPWEWCQHASTSSSDSKTFANIRKLGPKLKKPPSSDGFSNWPKRPKGGL